MHEMYDLKMFEILSKIQKAEICFLLSQYIFFYENKLKQSETRMI